MSAVSTLLWIASLFFGAALTGSWAVLVGVVGTAAFVASPACLLAWLLAPSYVADVAELGPLERAVGYLVRAGAYGIAGAGAGALLAEAIPRRMTEAASMGGGSISVAGMAVIGFGTAGAAFGLLEEWRRLQAHDDPTTATTATTTTGTDKHQEDGTMDEDHSLRAIDRWVMGAMVIIAMTLIVASVLRPDALGTYLSALGGVGAIAVACFVFGR